MPAQKRAATSLRPERAVRVVGHVAAHRVAKAEMRVAAAADRSPATGLGVNEASSPCRRATSRTTSRVTRALSAASRAGSGGELTSYWPSPYSGSIVSTGAPAARSAASIATRTGCTSRTAANENGVRGLKLAHE